MVRGEAGWASVTVALILCWLFVPSVGHSAPPPDGYKKEGKVKTAHFEVHWERDSTDPDYVPQRYRAWAQGLLERSWAYQVRQKGYDEPPGDKGERIRVDIWQFSNQGQCIWTFPPLRTSIEIRNYMSTVNAWVASDIAALGATCTHEFFHCVQASYVTRDVYANEKWIVEGTAMWMEDDHFDKYNDHLVKRQSHGNVSPAEAYLNTADESLFAQTGISAYGCSLFYIFLTKNENVDMKAVFEKFRALGGDTNEHFLEALEAALPGALALRTAFKEFALACHMKGDPVHGIKDDSAAKLPGVLFVSPDTDDYYVDYVVDLPQHLVALGDCLPDLAIRYVCIEKPNTLKEPQGVNSPYIPTDLHTRLTKFEDQQVARWGTYIIDVSVGGQKALADFDNEGHQHKVDDNFGGAAQNNIKFQDMIVARLLDQPNTISNRKWKYWYEVMVVPFFDGEYIPGDGGTALVKNAGTGQNQDGSSATDNWYKNGETVKLEVDVSAQANITCSFFALDSEYESGDEQVGLSDVLKSKYAVNYPISEQNVWGDCVEKLAVRCQAVGLINGDPTNTLTPADRFTAVLDNTAPSLDCSLSSTQLELPGGADDPQIPNEVTITLAVADQENGQPFTDIASYDAEGLKVWLCEESNPTPVKTFDVGNVTLTWSDSVSAYLGEASVEWDGTDDAGQHVAGGNYIVCAEVRDKAGNKDSVADGMITAISPEPCGNCPQTLTVTVQGMCVGWPEYEQECLDLNTSWVLTKSSGCDWWGQTPGYGITILARMDGTWHMSICGVDTVLANATAQDITGCPIDLDCAVSTNACGCCACTLEVTAGQP